MRRTRTMRRYAVPAAIATGAITVAGVGGIVLASTGDLPDKSPDEVLAALQESNVDGFSGTVQQEADLGLPAPGTDSDRGGLSAGSNTLGVWYAGGDKARIQNQGDVEETDYIRNAENYWEWNSADGVVREVGLSGKIADTPMMPLNGWDPIVAAKGAAGDAKGTDLELEEPVNIAGRDAYMLVMSPTDDNALVGEARVAVDGENGTPLAAEFYANDADSAALSYSFEEVNFEVPGDENFQPPEGEGVEKISEGGDAKQVGETEMLGGGWTTISKTSDSGEENLKNWLVEKLALDPNKVDEWVDEAEEVEGGRVLESNLMNAYLSDDDELFVGSVSTDALIQAANG